LTHNVVKAYRHSMTNEDKEQFAKCLEAFQKEAHEVAVGKGWYNPGMTKTPVESLMLMVSELAEACEELRIGTPPLYKVLPKTQDIIEPSHADWNIRAKPEGVAAELADVFIRIIDFCAHENIPLSQAILEKHEFNTSRPFRHGNKKY
jgi:NTP pyrophosphatase (non-canonical NTP hydrolase)